MSPESRRQSGRTSNGRFKKGASGNPGGRPKIEGLAEMREALKLLVPRAVEVLAEIMDDRNASSSARLAAANAILDRVFGKPTQAIDHSVTPAFDADEIVKAILRGEEAVREQPALPARIAAPAGASDAIKMN